MLIPVACLSCGSPIGDKADLFGMMRAKKVLAVLEKRDVVPSLAALDPGLEVDCEDILDRLQIRHDCCRTHLVTAMLYSDYY